MHATCRALQFGAAFLILVHAGCSRVPKPGVTGNVFVLTRGNDGQAVAQEPATRLESVPVNTVREIPHEGQTLSLLVRKTEFEKGTFEVTFPDQTTQRVRVGVRESKDVLPEGQKIGLRIELQESH
jgi:hypothetical protein